MTELGSRPFLVAFELRLQGGELGERRIRIGLAAAALFGRIAPLARLIAAAAIAILEIAPSAFAARAAILTVAIWRIATAALALRRTPFPLALLAAFSLSLAAAPMLRTIMTRTVVTLLRSRIAALSPRGCGPLGGARPIPPP